jgi:hypothetical protein
LTRNARIALLAAAGVVAIGAFVVLRPNDEPDPPADRAAATATPTASAAAPEGTPTPTPTPTPKPKPKVPLLTGSTVKQLEASQGDTVRFAARSPQDDEIHVHGYDRSVEAPAGKTVQVSFKATITGIFEIEFEHAGKPIAELKVEP